MPIGEFCVRQVVVAGRETPVLEAAKLMRQFHVGDIVVADEANQHRIPVGLVTDRDIVLEVLGQDLDATNLTVGDIMTGDLVTVRENEGVFRAIQLMSAKGVRRIPVVDEEGALVGIVSTDDLIELLAEQLGELAKLISREQKLEAEIRR